MYVCTNVRMYVCMYVRMYMHVLCEQKANMSSAASPKSYKLPPTIVKQTPVKTQLDDSHFCW